MHYGRNNERDEFKGTPKNTWIMAMLSLLRIKNRINGLNHEKNI
jgi:hypothetical protein